jgi:hypothetical protein
MPTVTTTFVSNVGSSSGQPPSIRTSSPLRVKLSTVGLLDDDGNDANIIVEFPFGPQNMSHDKSEARFREIARPGKKPLLAIENQQLRTISFNTIIADKASGGVLPVQDILDDIESIAANGHKCKLVYANTGLSYFVKITKYSFEIQYRNTDGEPTRVSAQFQLTEAPSLNQEITLLKAVFRQPNITTDPPAPPPPLVDDEGALTEWGSMQVQSRWTQLMNDAGIDGTNIADPWAADILYQQAVEDVIPK